MVFIAESAVSISLNRGLFGQAGLSKMLLGTADMCTMQGGGV